MTDAACVARSAPACCRPWWSSACCRCCSGWAPGSCSGPTKRALLASYEARRGAEPVSPGQLEGLRDPAYVRVRLHGRFDERHTLLLDNRLRNGQAGVEVLQPFYDQASGLWLLVNRGWVAWTDRRSPPTLETPTASSCSTPGPTCRHPAADARRPAAGRAW